MPSNRNAQPPLVAPETDRLCARCRTIDVEAIFQMKIKMEGGSFIVDLGASVEELKASHCDMCQLFGSISPTDFSEDGSARSERCHLRAFSANRVFARLPVPEMRDIHDTTLLGIVRVPINVYNDAHSRSYEFSLPLRSCLEETGYLCSTQANLRQSILEVRRLSLKAFDLKFATDCLAYCLENHHVTCSVIERSSTELMGLLHVIDCHTRTIIQAPAECQYVALSYVWGCHTSPTTGTEDQNIQSTLQNAPKVVNDAIDVTLKFHLRYLWVDRYCIDQSNKDDKHNQIRLMDLIYANARLTVIAAAGEMPDYGLPGVGGTLRKLQPSLKVGKHFMVSTLPHPSWSVRNSKWASRGWTYQEGLLSKRRLVFTNEQAFYECNGMYCTESLDLPLDKLHIKSKETFRENTLHGAFIHKTPGKKPWQVMEYVAEFNKRELTFPKDAINAMQGIFHSFSNSRRPVYQFVGVPILPPEVGLDYHTSFKPYTPTDRNPEECFLIGLSWYHKKAGVRRQDFPSWSWAGWVGKLSSSFMFREDSFSRLNDVKVWIEDDDGTLLSFPRPEHLQYFLARDYCKNRFIHIEAITILFSVVYLQRDSILSSIPKEDPFYLAYKIEKDGYYAKFKTDKDTFVYARVNWDQREQDLQQRCREPFGNVFKGILVGKQSSDGFVLVVQEMGICAERVGCSQFRFDDCIWCINDKWIFWASLQRSKNWMDEIPKVREKVRLG
jgi:hypothetical protein